MTCKFVLTTLALLASFSTLAGVRVTSVDLKTNGPHGFISVAMDGRSGELPDMKVYGKTIEMTLSDSEAFNAIFKNVSGAQLSANVLNGKAIVKAILPYDINPDGVNLGWKGKNIEIIFPRGRVVKLEEDKLVKAQAVLPKVENKILKTVENAVPKDALNEDYLNKLMKEEAAAADKLKEQKQDEVSLKQAASLKTSGNATSEKSSQVLVSKNTESFSFAGYAVKFGVFLALVLGLFYGVVQLLKKGVFNRGKLGFLNNTQMIQVLSTTYIAPKRSLMVVKAHKQIFLVANSENGIQFLSEMKDTAGLIKEGEKDVTGTNFDLNLSSAEITTPDEAFKIKENISESTPVPDDKGIQSLSARDIVKFSDELKKKARKLKPIEFN
jgi:flagellar biogenesis protein FliO